MGYIKEPKGVDFFVAPNTLSEQDVIAISEAIKEYKTSRQVNNGTPNVTKAAASGIKRAAAHK